MHLYQVFRNSGALAGNNTRLNYCPRCGALFEKKELGKFARQTCGQCNFVYYLNPDPGVTVLIRSPDKKILIGKRAEKARYGGKWCLPGGYIEYEETFIETAHREVWEETGLEIHIEGIVNVVSNLLDDCHHTIVIILIADISSGRPQPGDDLIELCWIDRDQHMRMDYAFEADRKIMDCYFQGTITVLPVDKQFLS